MNPKIPTLAGLLLLSLTAFGADSDAPRTFKIGPSTDIHLDGESATAADLKAGFSADVTEDSFQAGFAGEVDAHTPTPKGGAKIPAAKPGAKPGPVQGGKLGREWVITAVSPASITVTLK